MSFSSLKQELALPFSGRIAPNRVLKSAMSEKLASFSKEDEFERGEPSEALIRLYEVWGQGQIGIIVTGNIMVHRGHLETGGNVILDRDIEKDYTPLLSRLATAAKAGGSLLLAQISHPGRQTPMSLQPHPVSASAVQLVMDAPDIGLFGVPHPLTMDEIKDIADRFAWASRVLYNAGFDGMQIHGAHGYLMVQFLSPHTNKRTDAYGGSVQNRARILYEIVDAVRAAVPDERFVISVKLNTTDFVRGGLSIEDSIEVAKGLQAHRVDLIELSGGSYETMAFEHRSEKSRQRGAYFIEAAEVFKRHLTVSKLAVTGGFRSAEKMDQAIASGTTDVVGLGIPLCGEPHLIKDIFEGKVSDAKPNLLPGVWTQVAAAQKQLHAIARGEKPDEYTTPEAVARWNQSRSNN
ncbi:FMN-linked oxidoreductase [Auricularia subglabra TFB-10046 SS5]|nr:FMN-linked oxidoreductase [Auricularia subglabra TFB-10046 SS5]